MQKKNDSACLTNALSKKYLQKDTIIHNTQTTICMQVQAIK